MDGSLARGRFRFSYIASYTLRKARRQLGTKMCLPVKTACGYADLTMRIEDCPVKAALDVIGGKWKPLILFELKNGPRRFGELRRAIPGVRHKVLIEQLTDLQREGIVTKSVQTGKIVQSEYGLSDYGQSLRPVLESLAFWGSNHRELRARAGKKGTEAVVA